MATTTNTAKKTTPGRSAKAKVGVTGRMGRKEPRTNQPDALAAITKVLAPVQLEPVWGLFRMQLPTGIFRLVAISPDHNELEARGKLVNREAKTRVAFILNVAGTPHETEMVEIEDKEPTDPEIEVEEEDMAAAG